MPVLVNVGANYSYPASALAPTVPAVNLTATTDDLGGGASITERAWTIISQPVGGGASLGSPTSQNTTFGPFAQVGTYIACCAIKNNLNVWSEQDYRLMPDTAVVIVRVRTANADIGLPGYKEKGGGPGAEDLFDLLNSWFVRIDRNDGRLADIWVSAGVIQADEIRSFNDDIHLNADVNLTGDADTISFDAIDRFTAHAGSVAQLLSDDDVEIEAGADLDLFAVGALDIAGDSISLDAESTINIAALTLIRLIADGYAQVELTNAGIELLTITDRTITLSSSGALTLGATGAAANVDIYATDGDINLLALAAGRDMTLGCDDALTLYTEAGDIGIDSFGEVLINAAARIGIEAAQDFSVESDGVLFLSTDDIAFEQTGYRRVFASRIQQVLDCQVVFQATTGTSEELLDAYTIPDDWFTVTGMCIRIEAWYHGVVAANDKVYTVKLDGTTLYSSGVTSSTNDLVSITIDLFAQASNGQFVLYELDFTGARLVGRGGASVDMTTGPKAIGFYATTPDNAGDVTLDAWRVSFTPTTNV